MAKTNADKAAVAEEAAAREEADKRAADLAASEADNYARAHAVQDAPAKSAEQSGE